MARIAVRTLTLNVFRVSPALTTSSLQLQDAEMMKFVVSRAQDYFSKLAKQIAQQVIEMDTFARSAQNEATNRDRLLNMIDNHLDHMHYVNDVLSIKNEELVSCAFFCTLRPRRTR